MSLQNKFMRSLIICAAALGITASLIPPAHAADGSDVAIGVLGGAIIAGLLYRSYNRQHQRGYATSNRRYDDDYRYDNRYEGRHNRQDYINWQRNRHDHNRYNRRSRY